jgi:hypothetical protein
MKKKLTKEAASRLNEVQSNALRLEAIRERSKELVKRYQLRLYTQPQFASEAFKLLKEIVGEE